MNILSSPDALLNTKMPFFLLSNITPTWLLVLLNARLHRQIQAPCRHTSVASAPPSLCLSHQRRNASCSFAQYAATVTVICPQRSRMWHRFQRKGLTCAAPKKNQWKLTLLFSLTSNWININSLRCPWMTKKKGLPLIMHHQLSTCVGRLEPLHSVPTCITSELPSAQRVLASQMHDISSVLSNRSG